MAKHILRTFVLVLASSPLALLGACQGPLEVESAYLKDETESLALQPAAATTNVYKSNVVFPVGVITGKVLVDATRNNRQVPILIRYPVGATGPRPVIVWSHGGTPSPSGQTRSQEWSELLAAAGYVMIHPAHLLVADTTPFAQICADNGFSEGCGQFLGSPFFRPIDLRFVIDSLATIETLDPALNGLLDETKVGVGAHSGGTISGLSSAGAWQQWVPTAGPYVNKDNRPLAYLLASPMGPVSAGFIGGFQKTSYTGIDRPTMFLSGIADETGEDAETRRISFNTSVPGDKFLMWDTSPTSVHETFNIHKCDQSVRQSKHCKYLGYAGLAFFDAYLRKRPKAINWLASDAIAQLSGGLFQFTRR